MKSQGFKGKITNTSLHDVIQLICIGRCTCRMNVKSGARRGTIHFKEGEIVHARNESVTGEEAFYGILSWELGVFDCTDKTGDTETINESWDFLLMESLRRLDAFKNS